MSSKMAHFRAKMAAVRAWVPTLPWRALLRDSLVSWSRGAQDYQAYMEELIRLADAKMRENEIIDEDTAEMWKQIGDLARKCSRLGAASLENSHKAKQLWANIYDILKKVE